MKKNICLVMLLAIALFIGIRTSNAEGLAIPASLPVYPETYECDEGVVTGDVKKTTCTIKVTANQTTTVSGSNVFEVKFNKPHSESKWEIVTDGDLGMSDKSSIKTTSTGGTFTFTYSGTIEAGKKYSLVTIAFYSNKSYTGEDCGGTISPISGGDTTSGDKTSTVTEEDLGVSVPVAIIGIGAVAGLAIYSVSSRKTKFHRI